MARGIFTISLVLMIGLAIYAMGEPRDLGHGISMRVAAMAAAGLAYLNWIAVSIALWRRKRRAVASIMFGLLALVAVGVPVVDRVQTLAALDRARALTIAPDSLDLDGRDILIFKTRGACREVCEVLLKHNDPSSVHVAPTRRDMPLPDFTKAVDLTALPVRHRYIADPNAYGGVALLPAEDVAPDYLIFQGWNWGEREGTDLGLTDGMGLTYLMVPVGDPEAFRLSEARPDLRVVTGPNRYFGIPLFPLNIRKTDRMSYRAELQTVSRHLCPNGEDGRLDRDCTPWSR